MKKFILIFILGVAITAAIVFGYPQLKPSKTDFMGNTYKISNKDFNTGDYTLSNGIEKIQIKDRGNQSYVVHFNGYDYNINGNTNNFQLTYPDLEKIHCFENSCNDRGFTGYNFAGLPNFIAGNPLTFNNRNYTFVSTENNISHYKYKTFELTVQTDGNKKIMTYLGQNYQVTGTQDNYTVTYPNGTKQTYQTGTQNFDCMSEGYNPYVNSTHFRHLIPETVTYYPTTFIMGVFIFGILGLIFSLWSYASPESFFKFENLFQRWRYRDSEPSDLYLRIAPVISFIVIVASVAALIFGVTYLVLNQSHSDLIRYIKFK